MLYTKLYHQSADRSRRQRVLAPDDHSLSACLHCNTATCCRNRDKFDQKCVSPSHANFIQESNVDLELDLHAIVLDVRCDVSMLELNILATCTYTVTIL